MNNLFTGISNKYEASKKPAPDDRMSFPSISGEIFTPQTLYSLDRAPQGESKLSWDKDESNMVSSFIGLASFASSAGYHIPAVKTGPMLDSSLSQLNLDSPQHALCNGYRVWGVKMLLWKEGKEILHMCVPSP